MEQVKKTVAGAENDQVSRKLLSWLNECPSIPEDIGIIGFEYLTATPSMALSTIQAAYITRKYLLGGYQAEYQFKLIYRIKPGDSIDKRLKADETLNTIADWAELYGGVNNSPYIGDGKRVIGIEATTRSSVFAMYEGGEEDHQILMKMNYEVI